MKNVVIAGYARSPFTLANRGALAKVRPDELVGQVVKGLVEKTKVNAADIEDLIMGCGQPAGEGEDMRGRRADDVQGGPGEQSDRTEVEEGEDLEEVEPLQRGRS